MSFAEENGLKVLDAILAVSRSSTDQKKHLDQRTVSSNGLQNSGVLRCLVASTVGVICGVRKKNEYQRSPDFESDFTAIARGTSKGVKAFHDAPYHPSVRTQDFSIHVPSGMSFHCPPLIRFQVYHRGTRSSNLLLVHVPSQLANPGV